MKIVDARGIGCPMPVIMTKKAIEEGSDVNINVIIDNEIAKENIIKLIKKVGLNYSTSEKEGDITITITKDGRPIVNVQEDQVNNNISEKVIVINKEFMGTGDDKLGKILMNGFLYSLTETLPLPKAIIFYNGGVKLACEESQALQHIKELSDMGVEIVCCGTCLDFFELKNELKVGQISNMYSIVEYFMDTDRVITI